MVHCDIVVVGAGLAGTIAALAYADQGHDVVCVAPRSETKDGRTTALMDQSISLLSRLGLWDEIRPFAAPLSKMQIIDATGRLLRAPTVSFKCSEIGLDAFGYNIPNAPLLASLENAMQASPKIRILHDRVTAAEIGVSESVLHLESGESLTAGLVVGADGRHSMIRQAAGIEKRNWSYPQSAMVVNLSHTVPHHDTSSEFHTPYGPFTQVPLPGNHSSLVWVMRPQDAEALCKLEKTDLALQIERQMQSMLGKIIIESEVQTWPLSGMTASRFGKATCILVGEAAHVFPPIGAQGLNLSLRDIMASLELIAAHVGDDKPLAIGDAFDRRRRADVIARTASVDLFNRSLLSAFLPVQMLRAAGLQMLASLSPLRNAVMQEGIEPGRAARTFPDLLRKKIRRQEA